MGCVPCNHFEPFFIVVPLLYVVWQPGDCPAAGGAWRLSAALWILAAYLLLGECSAGSLLGPVSSTVKWSDKTIRALLMELICISNEIVLPKVAWHSCIGCVRSHIGCSYPKVPLWLSVRLPCVQVCLNSGSFQPATNFSLFPLCVPRALLVLCLGQFGMEWAALNKCIVPAAWHIWVEHSCLCWSVKFMKRRYKKWKRRQDEAQDAVTLHITFTYEAANRPSSSSSTLGTCTVFTFSSS